MKRDRSKKRPTGPLVCQDCKKEKDGVMNTYCPFQADVYNDPTVQITVCQDCYQQRAENI